MKDPKNIIIILVPVGQFERKHLEHIQNDTFKSSDHLRQQLYHTRRRYMNGEPFELNIELLTVSSFRRKCVFTKAAKPFETAIANIRKKKQCYNLSEFMDDFNNQEFGEDTDKYWMGYVRFK